MKKLILSAAAILVIGLASCSTDQAVSPIPVQKAKTNVSVEKSTKSDALLNNDVLPAGEESEYNGQNKDYRNSTK